MFLDKQKTKMFSGNQASHLMCKSARGSSEAYVELDGRLYVLAKNIQIL